MTIRASSSGGLIAVDPVAGDPVLESLLGSDLPVVTVGRILYETQRRPLGVRLGGWARQ